MTPDDGGGAPADSAGQPFAGRVVPDTGFSDDDGRVDRRLESVLADFAAGDATVYDVQRVLVDVRVFVPVVAEAVDTTVDEKTGLTSEKTTDMATVTLVGDDGRRGLLAFSSSERLTGWRADARPIPTAASTAAVAALDEDADALLLDLGGPVPFIAEGALLRALAQGRPWVRPAEDADVRAAVLAVFAEEPVVAEVDVVAGDSTDVSALVRLVPGVPAEELSGLGERIGGRLAESDVLRDRLANGLDVRVLPPAD